MSGGLSETLKAISTPRVQPHELHRDLQHSPRMVTVLRATPGTGGSLALQSQGPSPAPRLISLFPRTAASTSAKLGRIVTVTPQAPAGGDTRCAAPWAELRSPLQGGEGDAET